MIRENSSQKVGFSCKVEAMIHQIQEIITEDIEISILSTFTDDNHTIKWNVCLALLKEK